MENEFTGVPMADYTRDEIEEMMRRWIAGE